MSEVKKNVVLSDAKLDTSLQTVLDVFQSRVGKGVFGLHKDYAQCFVYATLGTELIPDVIRVYLSFQAIAGQNVICNVLMTKSTFSATANIRVVKGLGQILLSSMLKHGWISSPKSKAREK
jgi:hypothetical protein